MKIKKAIRLLLITMTALLCLGCLVSCTLFGEAQGVAEEVSLNFVDKLVEKDAKGAYEIVKNSCTYEEFKPIFDEMATYVEGAESYTVEIVGMHSGMDNGIRYYRGVYRITTDKEQVCTVNTVILLDDNSVGDIFVANNTPIIEAQKALGWLNITLKVISVLLLALGIWMLIDCIRRPMKLKALWIILIILFGILGGINISILTGNGNFNLSINYGISVIASGITADLDRNGLIYSLLIPVGTIIYFFCRKALSRKELARRAALQTPPAKTVTDNTPPSPVISRNESTEGASEPMGESTSPESESSENT